MVFQGLIRHALTSTRTRRAGIRESALRRKEADV